VHAADQTDTRRQPNDPGYRADPPLSPPLRVTLARLILLAAAALTPFAASAVPSCSATVMTGIAFGTYDVFSPAPLTSTGRLRLNCPRGQSPQITLSTGNSGRYAWRELRTPAQDALRYNVYLDPAMTVVWGDGTDGSQPYVSPGGNAQLVIYGKVPAGQDATPGDYLDLLTITVFL